MKVANENNNISTIDTWRSVRHTHTHTNTHAFELKKIRDLILNRSIIFIIALLVPSPLPADRIRRLIIQPDPTDMGDILAPSNPPSGELFIHLLQGLSSSAKL